MFNFDDITNEKTMNDKRWRFTSDNPYRNLMIGGSGFLDQEK